MASRRPKRPTDANQLGKLIVDLSVGEANEAAPAPDSPAIAFARLGGMKGGAVRAATLGREDRKRIAKRAADARWSRKRRHDSD